MLKKLSIICFITVSIFSCNLDTDLTSNKNNPQDETTIKENIFITELEDKLATHFKENTMSVKVYPPNEEDNSEDRIYIIDIFDNNKSAYTVFANKDFEMIDFNKNFTGLETDQILEELETYIQIFHVYNNSFDNKDYVDFTDVLREDVTNYFTFPKESFISYEAEGTNLSYALSTFILGINID